MKHWRPVLAVLIILAILALVLISPLGENVTGIFGKGISGFAGVFSLNTGKGFSFDLRSDKDIFYGQTYKVVNSTFLGKGKYTYIKVAGQNLAFRDTDTVDIVVDNMVGQFSYLQSGAVRISADTNNYVINNLISMTEKPVKIEFEIYPTEFVQTGLNEKRIVFDNIAGILTRYVGENVDRVSVSGKLEINNFYGSFRLEDDKGIFSGVSTLIKGNGFTFG